MFEKVGLQLIKEDAERVSLAGVVVGERFKSYSSADLSCCGLLLVHHKTGSPNDTSRPNSAMDSDAE